MYKKNVSLLYTDTDSLILEIRTENFYCDIKQNLNRFDTSNFKDCNIFDIPKQPSELGKMKLEFPSQIIREFYGTGAKAYCIVLDDDIEIKKAKGVSKHVIGKDLNDSDYQNAIENKQDKYCQMSVFQSTLHEMYTELGNNKVALSYFDDNRYLTSNSHTTLAWGHESIRLHELIEQMKKASE